MKDSLDKNIQAQIERLEGVQKVLQKRVKLERELQSLSDNFMSPDFDLEARFQSNMNSFLSFYPDIYYSFLNYNLERYELRFDEEFGVNIFDTQTNKYMYAENVFKSSYLQYKRFKSEPQYIKNNFAEREEKIDRFLHTRYLKKLTKFYLEGLEEEELDKLPNTISSMLIFGIGAGSHIEAMLEEHRVKNLYLYEPHLDLFYLSLFLTDWTKILEQLNADEAQLHLSLGEAESDKELVKEIADVFIKIGRFHAAHSYIYVHYTDKILTEAVAEVTKRFHENMLGFGFYDDALMSVGHFYYNMKNSVPLLKSGPLESLKQVPVFLVANGPSLDNDIEVVRAMQNRAIIISCGSAIGALHKYQITPDFHCEMERCLITKTVIDAVDDPEYVKSINLLALNTVQPEVFPLFKRSIQAMKTGEAGTALYIQNKESNPSSLAYLNYCNPTVSNCALAFVEKMGFENVYLFGVDMGYVGLQHHSKKSIYYSADSGSDRKLYDASGSELQVAGNFVETVNTDLIYNYSRMVIEEFLRLQPHLKVVNCSNGANIKGTQGIHSRDLPELKELDKNTIVESIFSKLTKPILDTDLKTFENNLQQEMFADLCDLIVEKFDEIPDSKDAAIAVLEEQLQRLEGFNASNVSHFNDLLRGSLLHTHSVLLNILNSYNSEQESLQRFSEAGKIVQEYVLEMKKEFLESPFKIDLVDDSHIWIE